jgi:hypothetical protein
MYSESALVGTKTLKRVANSMDKIEPKIATICKLLQAVGSPSWI